MLNGSAFKKSKQVGDLNVKTITKYKTRAESAVAIGKSRKRSCGGDAYCCLNYAAKQKEKELCTRVEALDRLFKCFLSFSYAKTYTLRPFLTSG